MLFETRIDAAEKLADIVANTARSFTNYHVVGLARGGVVIASGIARRLGLPLSSFLVDDIGEKETRQLFISPFGDGLLYQPKKSLVIRKNYREFSFPGADELFDSVIDRQRKYNGDGINVDTHILLCDDGIVSGKTMFAAAHALRRHCNVKTISVVVPVVPSTMYPDDLGVQELIFYRRSTLRVPKTVFYAHFDDVPDKEVCRLVRSAQRV